MDRWGFAAALLAGLLAAGCSSTPSESPGPSASASKACTISGYPTTNEAFPVDLSKSGLTCAPALEILRAYLALPDDGKHGNTKAYDVEGWFCLSPTAASSEDTNTVTACTKGNQELVVRPQPST
ncbi:hypothetical protein GCM10009858_44960 [Terrabacter carboxydivorans]|uniref:Lipoprotein n=1 Tax=Terrabacter carboxydivorans TaxID=619730 RepID=A0ABN3MGN7_9MICO